MNDDRLVQCPYVPSHRLTPGTRLQSHLLKCRKNQLADTTSPWHEKAKQMQICRFNQTHHVLDKADHEKTCRDRLVVANEVNKGESPSWRQAIPDAGAMVLQAPSPFDDDDDDECWDSENTSARGYNPSAKIDRARGKILFNPQGFTTSQRREFRSKQRMAANSEADWDEEAPPPSPPSPDPTPTSPPRCQPLRRPRVLQSLSHESPAAEAQLSAWTQTSLSLEAAPPRGPPPRGPPPGFGRGSRPQPPPGFGA